MWSAQPEAVGQVSQCHQVLLCPPKTSLLMKDGLASTGHPVSDERKAG